MVKLTTPYLNDRNKAVRNVLGYSSDFKEDASGQIIFTGKNQKGESLSDTEKKKIVEVETKYDAFYSFAESKGLSGIAAAAWAKKQMLAENKGTNTPPPPPPPPGGKPPVASNIPPPANLAPQIPTFGSN